MTRMMSCTLLIGAVVATTLVNYQEKNVENEAKPIPKNERIVVPHDDENAVARRDFMRTKLLFTQNIFEGLTTGDFTQINAGIKEVHSITEGERWVAIDDDLYRKLTEDFKTTTNRLREAADSGNLEAVALRYYQMSTSCIDCHKHIRAAEYEF